MHAPAYQNQLLSKTAPTDTVQHKRCLCRVSGVTAAGPAAESSYPQRSPVLQSVPAAALMLGRLPDPALTAAFSTRGAHQTHSGGPASSSRSAPSQWPPALQRDDTYGRNGSYKWSNRSNASSARGHTSGSSNLYGSGRQSKMQASVPGMGQTPSGLSLADRERRTQQEEHNRRKWHPSGLPSASGCLQERLLACASSTVCHQRHVTCTMTYVRLVLAARPAKPRELTAPAKLHAARPRHSAAASQAERAPDYNRVSVAEPPPYKAPLETWDDVHTREAEASQPSTDHSTAACEARSTVQDDAFHSVSSNGAAAQATQPEGRFCICLNALPKSSCLPKRYVAEPCISVYVCCAPADAAREDIVSTSAVDDASEGNVDAGWRHSMTEVPLYVAVVRDRHEAQRVAHLLSTQHRGCTFGADTEVRGVLVVR